MLYGRIEAAFKDDLIDEEAKKAAHNIRELGRDAVHFDPDSAANEEEAVILGLITGVLPWAFGWAIIIREVVIAVGAAYGWSKGVRRLDVRWLGKLATLLLYFSITTFYIADGLDMAWLWWASLAIGVPGLVTYYIVAFNYLGDMRSAIAAAETPDPKR